MDSDNESNRVVSHMLAQAAIECLCVLQTNPVHSSTTVSEHALRIQNMARIV